MKRTTLFSVLFSISFFISFCQERIPPPCLPNQNTGADGIIGQSSYIGSFTEGVINFSFSLPTMINNSEFNDVFVLYISNGNPGRINIDSSVDDAQDVYRIAITNSNVNGFASNVNFPAEFEITYAIAIDINGANLYSIPETGPVGNGELPFITAVNSTLTSNTQTHFDLSFTPSDIGISDDSFYVFGIYIRQDGFTFDEAYGDGIAEGTSGSDEVTFTQPRAGGPCFGEPLSLDEFENEINALYYEDQISLNGIFDEVKVIVYNLLGETIFDESYKVEGNISIPINLESNSVHFISLETRTKKKILKIIPH